MINIQAINLLKGLEQSLDDYCELNDEGKTAFRMAIAALELFGNAEQLPSAQPEIIRCKDCKHRDKYGCCKYWKGLAMGDIPIATDDYDFCSMAKRRGDG